MVFGQENSDYDTLTDETTVTEIVGPYKMGTLITCMEQNDESPLGFSDPIYSDEPDKETGEISEMCTNSATKIFCDRYKDESYPYPKRGDVCGMLILITFVSKLICKCFSINKYNLHRSLISTNRNNQKCMLF